MPKLSINESTTRLWSFEQDVLAYQECGVDALGVQRQKVAEFGEERAIELLAETRLRVSNLVGGGGFTGAGGRGFRDSVQDALAGIELAAELRAGCFVLTSGPRWGHTTNHARRLVVDALKELAPAARERQVRLALEPTHRSYADRESFVSTLDDAIELIDGAGQAEVGVVLDTHHVGQEDRLIEKIEEHAGRIAIVQLGDWSDLGEGRGGRARLGEGTLPLKHIVRSLDAAGYDGFYDVEVSSDGISESEYPELLRQSRDAFEALWE